MGYSSQPINCQDVTLTRGSHTRAAVSVRSGFSLIEVMIAIVLLGFGLVMVATMYPIAWNRARTMTEQSMTGSIADSAEVLLRRVLQVDGSKIKQNPTAQATDRGSFAGDMVWTTEVLISGALDVLCFSDSRVHPLHMENILVSPKPGPRRFFPDRQQPGMEISLPYRLDRTACSVPWGDEPQFFYQHAFGAAQIRFEDRLFPPLDARDPMSLDVNGRFVGDDPKWDEALDTRRFAYAVFHRQRGFERKYVDLPEYANRIVGPDWYPNGSVCNPFPPPMTYQDLAGREAERERSFDLFIVTLRRGQSSYRFAQQDPDVQFTPDPFNPGKAVKVKALPLEQDVLLPVPWRVQIYIPQPPQSGAIPYASASYAPPTLSNPPLATGIPSIVRINDSQFPTSDFVVDFFQDGTWFIDELNGEVYQVVNRRLEAQGSGVYEAVLTLDREITVEDIDDYCECLPSTGTCDRNHIVEPPFEGTETLRSVWVFPPPTQGRDGSGNPIYEGDSPVIGVEVRTLSYSPRP